VRGAAGEAEFTDDVIHDTAVARVASRVRPYPDAAMAPGSALMTVRLADGRVLEEHIRAARGTAENPQSREELEAKFERLCQVGLPRDKVFCLVETLRGFEGLADVGALTALASPDVDAGRRRG
jgi:2-methylcitrate dehydratase PrpD